MHELPLISTCPPRLSNMVEELSALEASGIFTNHGPVVRRFEAAVTGQLFGGTGACLTVPSATLGLMVAIRHAREGRAGRYALMPSFTFAATAHAAIWAGLTPLLVDSDFDDWAASAAAEEEALARHRGEIAVIVPYDTFGTAIDLGRYARLSEQHDAGVVVDAASSLGTLDAAGRGFATGARFATVFSMHATKPFATGEGGLIYSADPEAIEAMRRMSNYGFAGSRSAVGPGLNAKLSEVAGLLALAKLEEIEKVAEHRAALNALYREYLGGRFTLQKVHATRLNAQFLPLLLPRELAGARDAISAALAARGIGSGRYFSPHLAEQPWFRKTCLFGPTPVADDIGARMLSLPVTDRMTAEDVEIVCDALASACTAAHPARSAARVAAPVHSTLLVGGGPAGAAMLISASKQDRLAELARAGLVVVERSASLGGGELGSYAITSDSTAETFLSAVKDNVHASIAELMDHPTGREIADYTGALGVPLARTGPFLEAIGARVGQVVTENGGSVLTRHEVVESRRTPAGLWQTRVRDCATGAEHDILSQNIVIATGGYQSPSEVAAAVVAGRPLGERLGSRLILSDEALRLGGIDRLRVRLADVRAPRIAVVGASTSALAAAALLLKSGMPFGEGALTLLHREPLRPFYHSVEAAHADGFTDFGPDDICPVSGFVYRLAGFRLEARELVLRMLGIGGRAPDPRFRLHRITGPEDAEAGRILDGADLVIGALGYRPHALPLLDEAGERIALSAHGPGRPRLVDQQCRVIDAEGRPLPGAYGIGLAAGFVPEGALGGEPSFKGKANGLWLWQNDVGQRIVGQLLDARARQAA
ncbi:MAG TPA: DegT/DnrJ/EryC1/StrS family aminotransferase [Sphingomonas sp.]|nr:DegT/DnrJ/EryC1/StrS family aminotransferase [Sphingomonas sp.]